MEIINCDQSKEMIIDNCSSILNSKNNSIENNHLKEKILKYHHEHCTSKRVDVSKIVNEYQTKFDVPKCMIIKWLGLTTQKSLFKKYDTNKCDFDINYEESVNSEFSNSQSNSDSNDYFFDLEQPKKHSSKEIGSSTNVTDSNTPQEYSSGKIIDIERKIMNRSDDQKHNKNKFKIRIKKSRFGIKISQMKCKSPVASSNKHLLFDISNQCKRRIIKDLAVLRVNSPKNEVRSPQALKVNGCSLKIKGLNSFRNINNVSIKTNKFKEMEIFNTKWMDKLNESDFVPNKQLLSSEKEENPSTQVNLPTGRSRLPKLKISMPITKNIANFSCVSPVCKNKFVFPLSPVNNRNRRRIPTVLSPTASPKTLLNF